jgi:hypothetical protein
LYYINNDIFSLLNNYANHSDNINDKIWYVDRFSVLCDLSNLRKENVKNITSPIDKIKLINGVEFDWTQKYIDQNGGEDSYFMRRHDVGVIAQEIEAVLPEVVATRENGIKAVKYDRIVALLIEAIKDQQKQIDVLKNKVGE